MPLIFETFSRYGQSDHFHHLDILAIEEFVESEATVKYWDRIGLSTQAQERPQPTLGTSFSSGEYLVTN
ncbi:hypothetical protein GCM10009861_05460 [Neomicrococcus aestuarii]